MIGQLHQRKRIELLCPISASECPAGSSPAQSPSSYNRTAGGPAPTLPCPSRYTRPDNNPSRCDRNSAANLRTCPAAGRRARNRNPRSSRFPAPSDGPDPCAPPLAAAAVRWAFRWRSQSRREHSPTSSAAPAQLRDQLLTDLNVTFRGRSLPGAELLALEGPQCGGVARYIDRLRPQPRQQYGSRSAHGSRSLARRRLFPHRCFRQRFGQRGHGPSPHQFSLSATRQR